MVLEWSDGNLDYLCEGDRGAQRGDADDCPEEFFEVGCELVARMLSRGFRE